MNPCTPASFRGKDEPKRDAKMTLRFVSMIVISITWIFTICYCLAHFECKKRLKQQGPVEEAAFRQCINRAFADPFSLR